MIRLMFIYFLAALIVFSAAMPKLGEDDDDSSEENDTTPHNFRNGHKYSENDTLIYDDEVRMFAKVNKKVGYHITFRASDRFKRISMIEARDLHSNISQQGWAWIVGGSVGYEYVTIYLESIVNQTLEFHLRAYEGVDPYTV